MKTPNPLVSIIVPTYNLQNYISETLDSILAQEDFENFEVLVIDDKSTDSTLTIINSYAKKDPRIKVFENKRKKGASGARNTGIENAQGEWITFLDGDDLWEKNILSTEIAVLNEYPDAQLISANFYVWFENGRKALQTDEYEIWGKNLNQANETGKLFCLENPVECFIEDTPLTRAGVFLIKSKLFNKVGYFDEELEVWEDSLLWIKLARCVDFMVYIPKPLMTYRHRSGSLTHRGTLSSAFAVIGLKKLLRSSDFKQYKDMIAKQIGIFALESTYFYRKKGQKLKAIQSAFDGIVYDAKNIISWKCFVAACLFF